MSIYVTGDTHGGLDIPDVLLLDNAYTGDIPEGANIRKVNLNDLVEPYIKLTENDYVIVCGDFGFPFSPMDVVDYVNNKGDYSYWVNWFKSRPYTVLFVDGNHDNHEWWSTQEKIEKFGGIVQPHPHIPNVYHLLRGQIYTIENKTFFTFGGATSVDKAYRTEHISWWAAEMPSKEEYEFAVENLEKHDMTIDYVISHDCGSSYYSDVGLGYKRPNELTKFFNILEFDFGLKFKHWYFGHHHRDKKIDDQHTCVYHDVIKID